MTEINSQVTPEQFVKVWQESKSAREVANKLGMRATSVNGRVQFYRRKGIKLKRHNGSGRTKLDVKALNAIVANHVPGK